MARQAVTVACCRPPTDRPKYVASATLTEPLKWQNSSLLKGDIGDAVRALKRDQPGDLRVIGSAELVRTLVQLDLVDEYQVIIDPLIVGGGKRIFPEDGALRSLRLVDATPTSTGAIIATFATTGN